MSDMVSITKDGAVWEIVFDRPKANAVSVAASKALSAAFCSFRDDPTASVAIITGGGEKFFSAGWDLKAAAAGEEDTDSAAGFDGGFAGLTELWSMDKPVIAAVNGYAAGGGFELALACDLIVTADHATFMLPEALRGITP
ncbi:MAG: carnitinyl-CoA dehydratase, partial [Rhodospirillaceae bacterium]|nr:carnitinyl-CoA dehydratase [Rhodospirillaceae bacterium]